MKNLIVILAACALFFSSCQTTNDVVSDSRISKRKYLKGYHIKNIKHARFLHAQQELAKAAETEKEYQNRLSIEALPVSAPSVLKLEKSKQSTALSHTLEPLALTSKVEAVKNTAKPKPKDLKRAVKNHFSVIQKNTVKKNGEGDTAALLSLIFGSIGLLFALLFALGILFNLAALILAIIGFKSEERKTLAILGLVFSLLGLIVAAAIWIFIASMLL